MKSIWLKFSFLGSILLIGFSFILYLGGVEWFMKPINLLHYLILLIIMVMIGMRTKASEGNVITVQKAFKAMFLGGVLMVLLYGIYNFVLFKADPEFHQSFKDVQRNTFIEMLKERNIEESIIEAQVEERNIIDAQQSLARIALFRWVLDCIVVAFLSIILALIIKTPIKR